MALRDGYRFLRYFRQSRRRPPGSYAPRAAVIVPCKGIDPRFEPNLSRFLSQDYAHYQAIFVVASENDPAYAALAAFLEKFRATGAGNAPETALVVAGFSEIRGEKVNNLLRGLSVANPEAEVLVFADIDARPGRDWLRSLVAPLAEPSVTVSTGFRWYLPGPDFVTQLRAAWDTSIATLLGDHNHNFAWGGSMAIRSREFKRLRVAEDYWARTVSDDYALTRATRDTGGRIRFEPRCLLASSEPSSLREFLRWANRQIIITRVYSPRLWWMGLISNLLYCGTFLLGVVLLVLRYGTVRERIGIGTLLGAVLLLGLAKGRIRARVAHEAFPEQSELLARYGSRYWQLAPLVSWVMLLNFAVSAITRRIEWRGTHYKLTSSHEVRVVQRSNV